jgi:hypothetical protein
METRRRRRHGTLRGGKVLGQGLFAKAIYPPIQCKDGRDMKGLVTRFLKDGDIDSLLSKWNPELIEKLKEIDPEQKYFFYPEYCVPGDLSKENIEDGVTEENKKYSEVMKKGFETWGISIYKRRTWMNYLAGRKVWINENKKYLKMFEHLIKGVELLHSQKICHNDLHPGNIILGRDRLPRIIDFGESTMNSPKRKLTMEMKYIKEYYSNYIPTSKNTTPN